MFKTIKEGLAVYKEKLTEHLKQNNAVGQRIKKTRDDLNLAYSGIACWPDEEKKANQQREHELDGMAFALGLTEKERNKIFSEISLKLKLPSY